jgi:hypothetical protein
MTNAQQSALRQVRAKAHIDQEAATQAIRGILKRHSLDTDVATMIDAIRHTGFVTINFHPDRICNDGRSVAAALYDDGVFKTQFETGISNGGLNRIVGGRRDVWETQLWGNVYMAEGVSLAERPKYGGLNLMNYSDGACPRFGSCHLRLKSELLTRCSFSFGDSFNEPHDIGVIDAFEPVLAALLQDIDTHGTTLGRDHLSVQAYINELLSSSRKRSTKHTQLGRALDNYIEAQIHNSVELANDVEAVVIDPSFHGTAVGELLEAIADKYHLEMEWHQGFELSIEKVPSDFRGEEMPSLAKFVAAHVGTRPLIDAATIGQAAVSVVTDPQQWQEWGTVDDALQRLKYLWHILVVYGVPYCATS